MSRERLSITMRLRFASNWGGGGGDWDVDDASGAYEE
jgi:hypothetical protein